MVATQEQRDAWRKAVEPVYPQIVKETGGTADAFYAEMEAGRKACNKRPASHDRSADGRCARRTGRGGARHGDMAPR